MIMEEESIPQQNIELKSPAVQEILGRPPRWIIRWGITVILLIIGGIFIGSYFIKYPDVVSATIEVTTENLPAQLVARTTGKLDTLFVANNQTIEKGEYLAVIENTADFNDVIKLQTQLNAFQFFFFNPNETLSFTTKNMLKLGELQSYYYPFAKSWEDYEYYLKANYFNQKINALKRQINIQQKLIQRSKKQCEISHEQLLIQERLFNIDSNLFAQNVIPLINFENAKNSYLQVQQSYENALSAVDNIQLTITQHEQNIFDLQQQDEEKRQELLLALSGTYEALQSQINLWEMQYVFKSPISGKAAMAKLWQKNQHVSAGESFINIVPKEDTQITGEILLPAQGAGKVKTGQLVNIKFAGFPHMEFGMVRGVITNISLVPIVSESGKFTMIEVGFPENLKTNYGKELDFSQQMSGTAEIITEDMRLMERFLNPIKSLINR